MIIIWIIILSTIKFLIYSSVWSFYCRARDNGTCDNVMKHFAKVTRKNAGRDENPSYAFIDSQSAKTIYYGDKHGYGGRKNKLKKAAHSN